MRWHPRLNLIHGLNGQGKTNLLEAVYYLSVFESFRGGRPEEMIRHQAPFFLIDAGFRGGGVSHTLKTAFSADKKRLIKRDGNICRQLNDVIGSLNTVVFSPDDLQLMKGGPERRRDFLDREILQMAPGSFDVFRRYRRCLRQRGELLKTMRERGGDPAVLDAFDRELSQCGGAILFWRKQAVDRLLPLVRLSHRRLSGGKEEVLLSYDGSFEESFWKKAEREDIERALAELIREHRAEDLRRGATTVGPHRDDLLFALDGEDLRRFGSQGQQRTAVLSLKLGELELMKGKRGEYPILLLDDVLSELDSQRRAALTETVRGRVQTFVTGTEPLPLDSDSASFVVTAGNLRET